MEKIINFDAKTGHLRLIRILE